MASKGRSKIFPHLWYAKEAEEAARFYASIFPDSRVDRVTPLLSHRPSCPPGSVKILDFILLGQRFQAMTAGPHHEFNDAISIVVLCDDQAELDRYWNALLEGGGKAQACGWLIDRFGLRWQIVPHPGRADARQGPCSVEEGDGCALAYGEAGHCSPREGLPVVNARRGCRTSLLCAGRR